MVTLACLDELIVLALGVFVLTYLPTLTQQVREQHAAQAPTAKQTAADQQANELVLLARVVIARCLLALIVFLLGLASFTQQVRKQQVAQATFAQDAAANQQANEFVLLVRVVIARCLLTLIRVVPGLASFTQQVRKQQVAQTAFAQDAAANQQAHDAPSLLLTFTLLALEVLILRFVAVTDETGKQRAAQPPTTHSASAKSQAREFLCFAHKSS
jgi:hypothetical protein